MASDEKTVDPVVAIASPTSLHQLDSHIAVPPAESQENDDLAHLPPDQQEILRRQLAIPDLPLTFFDLYRYATFNDMSLVAVGSLTAIIGGALLPCMSVLFGQLAQTFTNFALGIMTADKMQSEINRFTL